MLNSEINFRSSPGIEDQKDFSRKPLEEVLQKTYYKGAC